MSRLFSVSLVLGAVLLLGGPAAAADLYANSEWAAMASDRQASRVGDSLTVVIFENAVASNTAQNGTDRQTRLAGQISGGSLSETGQLSLEGDLERRGQTARSGKIVAQISVTVDAILPNGDLRVSGQQLLSINGERTHLRLKGRVRRADISSGNSVLSTRLADVEIDYDGTGFVTRGSKPGIVDRIFGWLGLL